MTEETKTLKTTIPKGQKAPLQPTKPQEQKFVVKPGPLWNLI